MKKITQIGRLAFRVEGMWWTVYFAAPDTMDGAVEIARIAMGAVQNEERKRAFMELMKDALDEFIEEKTGERPSHWGETRAPESERSGRA